MRHFNEIYSKCKGIEDISLHFLEELRLYPDCNTNRMTDTEKMNLPVLMYISEKYWKLMKPYKRGKHFKNVLRKIKRDENLSFRFPDKNVDSHYFLVSFRKGVAPLGQWHRKEGYPINSKTPDEAKAETCKGCVVSLG